MCLRSLGQLRYVSAGITTEELTQVFIRRCRMSQDIGQNQNRVYKLVLTGGPCGGKTTGQARLSTFFENLGWKVYRSPETALVLMSGGVKFPDLSKDECFTFQKNLIQTMMQIENTFFDLARTCKRDCLVICDRGVMDATAYLAAEDWRRMKEENGWNEVDLRDNRYNQILHMVSAACGAEDFYTLEGHLTRHEGIDSARKLDSITAQIWHGYRMGPDYFLRFPLFPDTTQNISQTYRQAWVGHPYMDVVDNSTDFEEKLMRMISAVCSRLGIDPGDRLKSNSRKRKFLVACVPDLLDFPKCEDFTVCHDYLVTPSRKMQARLRKRGKDGVWTYTHTIRRPEINNQSVELRMAVNFKDYQILLAQKDDRHLTINKQRRCFLWNNQYFQMDTYLEPCQEICKGLILLETYTTKSNDLNLPDFLKIEKEVTDDPQYSMFNLSLKDDCKSSLSNIVSASEF